MELTCSSQDEREETRLLPQHCHDLLKLSILENTDFPDLLVYSLDICLKYEAKENQIYHFEDSVKEGYNQVNVAELQKRALRGILAKTHPSVLSELGYKTNLKTFHVEKQTENLDADIPVCLQKQSEEITSQTNEDESNDKGTSRCKCPDVPKEQFYEIESRDVSIQTETNVQCSHELKDSSCQTEQFVDSSIQVTDTGVQTDEFESFPKQKRKKALKTLRVKLTPLSKISAEVDGAFGTVDNDHHRGAVVVPEGPSPPHNKSYESDELTCPLCPVRFGSQRAAEKHLRQKHDIGNIYICDICQDICPSNTALHEHFRIVHNKNLKEFNKKPVFEDKEAEEEEEEDNKKDDADYVVEEDYEIPKTKSRKRGRKPLKTKASKTAKRSTLKPFASQPELSTVNKKSQPVLKSVNRASKLKIKKGDNSLASNKSGSVSCSMCDKVYQSQRALRRHINIVHEDHDYKCTDCDKVFTSKETLYHHRRGMHGEKKPYTCEECGASFNFNHSLRLHALKHSGKRPYQCSECDKTYLTANHLKMHVQGVHKNKKTLSCKHCWKMFSYSTSLRVHELTHGNYRPYQCDVCGHGFINSHALKYHKESKHSDNKWFDCDICGKKYKTEFLMKTHRRRHTADGQRYMCDVCGRQFMYKSTLEIHTAVHRDDKSFQCSTCGKSFKTYATLYSHQYVHKSDSPFVCTECGKAFKTKERCKAHAKRHSGLKPFVCEECGRCFPDKGGLSKHIRTVHCIEKKFVCDVCGKACSRADNLRVHMKIHERRDVVKSILVQKLPVPSNTSKKSKPRHENSNEAGINVESALSSLNRTETDIDSIPAVPGRYDHMVDAVLEKSGMPTSAAALPSMSGQDSSSITHSPSISPPGPVNNRNFHDLNHQFMTQSANHNPSHGPFPLSLVTHHGDGPAGSMMPHPPAPLHPGPYAAAAYMWNPYMSHGVPNTSQAPDTNNYY